MRCWHVHVSKGLDSTRLYNTQLNATNKLLQKETYPPIALFDLQTQHLQSNPGDGDDNVHALAVGSLPLVGECAVLLVVPVGANGAVHAAAAVLLGLLGRAQVLDYGAVGNELEGGLLCRLALALALLGRLLDERLEDGLLRGGAG
jgi:hypothetical protein